PTLGGGQGTHLQLMPPLNDVSDIPTRGKNLIIVAAVRNVLHFRIFDGDGTMIVDAEEKKLREQARQIESLRKQLDSLWPPHEITESENSRLIAAVTSLVGHTRERASRGYSFKQMTMAVKDDLEDLLNSHPSYATLPEELTSLRHELEDAYAAGRLDG